jgi:hypothetical protein
MSKFLQKIVLNDSIVVITRLPLVLNNKVVLFTFASLQLVQAATHLTCILVRSSVGPPSSTVLLLTSSRAMLFQPLEIDRGLSS